VHQPTRHEEVETCPLACPLPFVDFQAILDWDPLPAVMAHASRLTKQIRRSFNFPFQVRMRYMVQIEQRIRLSSINVAKSSTGLVTEALRMQNSASTAGARITYSVTQIQESRTPAGAGCHRRPGLRRCRSVQRSPLHTLALQSANSSSRCR